MNPEKSIVHAFDVTGRDAGRRLDVIVADELRHFFSSGRAGVAHLHTLPSRSQVAGWVADGRVEVDEKPVTKSSFKPKLGANVRLQVPLPQPVEIAPDPSVRFTVVYEDDALLIIDKPAGLVVHPGAGQYRGTLVHGLVHYLGDSLRAIGDTLRPGIVHRLDKDTSGLMVVAKDEAAFQHLVRQFRLPRTMDRRYLALAYSLPRAGLGSTLSESHDSGVIELPIGRHPTDRVKMAITTTGGKEAKTDWRLREVFRFATLLEARLHTGRTHQIRVHFYAVGASLVGDPVYYNPHPMLPPALRRAVKVFGRQALHAGELSFVHPRSAEIVRFEIPPPEDLRNLINLFRSAV